VTQITGDLYLGDLRESLDIQQLNAHAIQCCLNLAHSTFVRSRLDPPHLMRVHFPLMDGGKNSIQDYVAVVRLVDVLVECYGRIFLHCLEGVSRSPFIAAVYLSWKLSLDFEQCLDRIKAGSCCKTDVHPDHLAVADEVLRCLRNMGNT